MLMDLIVVGGVFFWAILAIELLVLAILVENGHYLRGAVSIAVTAATIVLLSTVAATIDAWVRENVWTIVGAVVGHFAIGPAYMLFRWRLLIGDTLEHNKAAKAQWLSEWRERAERLGRDASRTAASQRLSHANSQYVARQEAEAARLTAEQSITQASGGKMTEAMQELWAKHEQTLTWTDSLGFTYPIAKPDKAKFADRLIAWAVLWEPSAIGWLLNDPLRRFGKWVYYRFAGILQSIADSTWKDS